VQLALSVSGLASAGAPLLAVTVQLGAVAAGAGVTEPPAGVQNTTGSAGLPSPSGLYPWLVMNWKMAI